MFQIDLVLHDSGILLFSKNLTLQASTEHTKYMQKRIISQGVEVL